MIRRCPSAAVALGILLAAPRRPAPGIRWNYRFETIQRCVVFQLAFDAATGKVIEGAYPPDPGCADEWM